MAVTLNCHCEALLFQTMLPGNQELSPFSSQQSHLNWFGSLCPDAARSEEQPTWGSQEKLNKCKKK